MVKGPHTYFVLEVGVLVHNAGNCDPDIEKVTKEYLDQQVTRPIPELTRQEADEALDAVKKYTPQNNPVDQAIKEKIGSPGKGTNCHGFTFCEYPRDYKNQKPITEHTNIDRFNIDGEDKYKEILYTGNEMKPHDELTQLPDELERLVQKNFDEIQEDVVRPGDVVSWNKRGPIFGSTSPIVDKVSHTGVYVQSTSGYRKDDLIFSKLGQRRYMLLPRSVLDKTYGDTVRYWRWKK